MDDSRRDISAKVGGMLLTWAFWSWVGFLFSFAPVPSSWEFLYGGVVKGGLCGAFVYSIITAGTSLWASLRVRRCSCWLAFATSGLLVPLAVYRLIIFR